MYTNKSSNFSKKYYIFLILAAEVPLFRPLIVLLPAIAVFITNSLCFGNSLCCGTLLIIIPGSGLVNILFVFLL